MGLGPTSLLLLLLLLPLQLLLLLGLLTPATASLSSACESSTPKASFAASSPMASTVASKLSKFTKLPGKDLHVSTPVDWLESRFHFSFADYWDPKREKYGVLRVLNDDIVKPLGGFPTHPHRDMEIISYVVDGGLTHKDSMGTQETLHRGDVQYMSAGTGVRHSEFNLSDKEHNRFLQLWIEPNQRGLKPNYGSRVFKPESRLNRLLHVITGDQSKYPDAIGINQDANIFVSEIENGNAVTFDLKNSRQVYLVCIEGDLGISDSVNLTSRDAIKISGPAQLVFSSLNKNGPKAHFLMVEMAASRES